MKTKKVFFAAPYEPTAEDACELLQKDFSANNIQLYRLPRSEDSLGLFKFVREQILDSAFCLAVFTRESKNVLIECAIAASIGRRVVCFANDPSALGILYEVADVYPLPRSMTASDIAASVTKTLKADAQI